MPHVRGRHVSCNPPMIDLGPEVLEPKSEAEKVPLPPVLEPQANRFIEKRHGEVLSP